MKDKLDHLLAGEMLSEKYLILFIYCFKTPRSKGFRERLENISLLLEWRIL